MYLFVNFRWILCWLPLDIEKGYQRNGMCTCFPEKDFIVTRNPEQTWNAQECLQSKVTKNEVQFCPNWEPVHWEVDQRRPPGGREFWGVFFQEVSDTAELLKMTREDVSTWCAWTAKQGLPSPKDFPTSGHCARECTFPRDGEMQLKPDNFIIPFSVW